MEGPYYVSAGTIDNDVWWAAKGYLDAAERLYQMRMQAGAEFWGMPKWYVIHHLCFIASELFLKSLHVKITPSSERDEDGFASAISRVPYMGHEAKLKKIPATVVAALERHLDPASLEVVRSIEKEGTAKNSFLMGRYPFDLTHPFPSGVAAQDETEKWLKVAQDLGRFIDPTT